MNKFLNNCFYFLLIFILVIISSNSFFSWFQNMYSNFELNERPKYLMLGHSHSACAYNDTIISDFINLSDLGESYFYTFIKLKKILEQNQSIETIFLEYSNNQLYKVMDEWIWGHEKMNYRYTKYSSYMNIKEHMVLFRNNPIYFIGSFSRSLRYKLEFFLFNSSNNISSLGGFKPNKNNIKKEDFEKYRHTAIEVQSENISEKNIEYLIKIIEYCKNNNLKMVLLRSPNLISYNNHIEYNRLLKNEFSDIDYFDLKKFPLKYIHFSDGQHLNINGAKLISEWFESSLTKDFIKNQKQKKIIQKEIESW